MPGGAVYIALLRSHHAADAEPKGRVLGAFSNRPLPPARLVISARSAYFPTRLNRFVWRFCMQGALSAPGA